MDKIRIAFITCDKCGDKFWSGTGVCKKCHGPMVELMAHVIGMRIPEPKEPKEPQNRARKRKKP